MASSPQERMDVKMVYIHDRRKFVSDKDKRHYKRNTGLFLNPVDLIKWQNHRSKIQKALPKVDDSVPVNVVQGDLKINMLNQTMVCAQKQFKENLNLVGRMNFIKKTTGLTDNYSRPLQDPTFENLRKLRLQNVRRIANENYNIYYRLQNTKSHSLSSEPKVRKIKNLHHEYLNIDTNSELQINEMSSMNKYKLRFKASDGTKIGWISVVLFDKVCPVICEYFTKLIEGFESGEGYLGTSVIKILADMFCTMGDVTKNNGFGGMVLQTEKISPSDQKLKHSSAGLLSMEIKDGLANGIFNLTFKPMPLLDSRYIVFGIMVESSPNLLKIMSKMGNSLGQPLFNIFISHCGWFKDSHTFVKGKPNKKVIPKYKKHVIL